MAHSKLQRGLLALVPCLVAACADVDGGALNAASTDPLAQQTTPAESPKKTKQQVDLPVTLRETGKATIKATIYENPKRAPLGRTVLAVHGLAETAATFEPLAQATFADATLGSVVQRVIAIDLVGHGDSSDPTGLPAGVTFGTLTIDDNISVIQQAIEGLRAKRLGADILVGHSMGGLAVQGLQERLLAGGKSLARLGITQAVLLAPVPAHGRPWQQPPPADLSAFLVQDPTLGAYVSLPPAVFIAQAFTTTKGVPAVNAPSVAVVTEKGYVGKEPLLTLLQLTEAPIDPNAGTVLPRPSVRAGAFGATSGTRLTLLSFVEDTLVPAADLGGLYDFLTGTTTRDGYTAVSTPDAVHSMYISNPAALLPGLVKSSK